MPVIHGPMSANGVKISGKGDYTVSKKEKEERPWYEEIGRNVGGFLTKSAVQALKTLSGFGDYQVNTNSILAQATNGNQGSQIPMMVNSKVTNIIRHREYLGNIRGSTLDFNATTFDINPGLDETFPWGYTLGNCYTSYRMRGLVYEFISLSSEYTGQAYLGYVAMATQYNALDDPFVNKKTMANSEYACSTKPSLNLMHPVECSADQLVASQLYIRGGDPPANADKRLYDMGRLTIATGGQASNGILGELWASYEIEFYQPKLGSATGSLINATHWKAPPNVEVPPGMPLTGGVEQAGSTLQITIGTGTGGIHFPPTLGYGTFLVTVAWYGAQTPGCAAPAPNFFGCEGIPNSFNTIAYATTTNTGIGNATTIFTTFKCKIVSDNAYVQFSAGGSYPAASATSGYDLHITQVPDALKRIDRSHILVDDSLAQQIRQEERDEYVNNLKERQLERDLRVVPRIKRDQIERYETEFFSEDSSSSSEEFETQISRVKKGNRKK